MIKRKSICTSFFSSILLSGIAIFASFTIFIFYSYSHLKIKPLVTLLILVFFSFITCIWLIIKKNFKKLTKIAEIIKNVDLTHLKTIQAESIPAELLPIIEGLNQFLSQIEEIYLREERFMADAAHELRTPLAALRAHVHVALHASSKKERNEALKKVNKGIERSSHVINQLLILNRIIRPKTKDLKKEPVSLNREAKNIIAELFPEIRKKNITIKLKTSKPHPLTLGYPAAIGILIRNLIDNSIRYGGENGSIQVIIARTKQHAILKVIDNGPGIPEKMRKQVFDRFFRIADNNILGSGLGLNIVQQIAKQHRAEIKLLVPPSGKGLEVDVIFKCQSKVEMSRRSQ